MKISVSRLSAGDVPRIAPAVACLSQLPFASAYRLSCDGVRMYLFHLFTDVDARGESGRLFIAEAGGAVVGALALHRIDWEGGIFGVEMARVPCLLAVGDEARSREVAAALLERAWEAFVSWGTQHVSAIVLAEQTGILHAFEEAGWRLVDSTLEFTWEVGRTHPGSTDPRLIIRTPRDTDRCLLRKLACDAYTQSIRTRWSADPWLPLEKTGELYARWFDLACDGVFGDVVAVAEVDGRAIGFNTFKFEPALSEATGVGIAAHGIAAVNPEYRGLGAQPAMLHYLAEWLGKRDGRFARGRVLINNYPMQRACLKSGAFVTQAYHTCHTWLGNSQ